MSIQARVSLFVGAALAWLACATTQSPPALIEQAASAEIVLYAMREDGSKQPYLRIPVNTEAELRRLADSISSTSAPPYKCGYHGQIRLEASQGSVIDMDFNLNPGCQHVAYVLDDEFHGYELTVEGAQYLRALFDQVPRDQWPHR